MTDTLLIPCWRRPEFLHHALTKLVATGDLHTVHVILKPDAGHDRDVIKVFQGFTDHMASWEVIAGRTTAVKSAKQSMNLLDGYHYAALKSKGLVFMVEEDIMVASDFFRYHRALHKAEPGLFCGLSTKNHNRAVTPTNDPDAYYLSHGDYCSLGVSFKAQTILEEIIPHVAAGYLANPAVYITRNFQDSTIGAFYEQDGLIRRIQEQGQAPTAYPHVPRAAHGGWYGYNRKARPHGSLQTRIELVGRTIFDREAMRAACLSDGHFADSEPINYQIEPWKSLRNLPV